MIEQICGRADRCKYAAKCPHDQRPQPSYLCFERRVPMRLDYGTYGKRKKQKRNTPHF